ncbi:DUF2478 domain-containing protein [Salinarimonas ramus]|uniref:Nucleoside-triphosphatase THEP1 n=1 Tax=Salinarimonas ramus TaxID=690164 RepID=A0A917V2C7_9HYPH|nr:DUF2478 domain-containing protein [Salinarimonas ramus]GGK22034.1 hypothetical protein GCM10011322_05860 [Salinarimonas ramus]
MSEPTPRIAALVYGRKEPVSALMEGFAARLRARGLRVAGLVEADLEADACLRGEMALRDLGSGDVVSICQDLGSGATGCRVDPRGLAEAGARLAAGLAAAPDCVVVNKFGKLEADGEGLADEIGQCVAQGVPLVIGVPARFRAAWDAFAGGLDTPLPATASALDAWWATLAREPASA